MRSSKSPKSITVVTNDIGLREKLRGSGVKIMSAAEFVALIDRKRREAAEARTRIQKEKPRLSQQELNEFMELFGVEPEDGD